MLNCGRSGISRDASEGQLLLFPHGSILHRSRVTFSGRQCMKIGFFLAFLAFLFAVSANAAWYLDRDNSMRPVSATEGPGAAMATVMSHRGWSQAVQVCDGVYLANVHNLVDRPGGPEGNGPSWHISAYPMSQEMVRELPDPSTFFSPRMETFDAWGQAETDYLFFRLSDPPNAGVLRPIVMADEQLAARSDVYLYRPITRYQQNSDGSPDFSTTALIGGNEGMNRLQVPYRVNNACEIIDRRGSSVRDTTCPVENGVSGSPYVLETERGYFLVGIHTYGGEGYETSYSERATTPNAFIQSRHFCAGYERMCGEPCAELSDVEGQ